MKSKFCEFAKDVVSFSRRVNNELKLKYRQKDLDNLYLSFICCYTYKFNIPVTNWKVILVDYVIKMNYIYWFTYNKFLIRFQLY